jgi:hypothetical protein
MDYGLSYIEKSISIMSGLLLIGKQEKLLAVLSGIGVVNPQKNYGKVCRQFIDNVPSLIPIFGKRMKKLFLANVTELLVKKADKSIILNVSIILYVKGFHDSSDKVRLFPKT